MSLHPIEAAWRRFRNSPKAELLKRALDWQLNYLDFTGIRGAPAGANGKTVVPVRGEKDRVEAESTRNTTGAPRADQGPLE